MSDDHIESLTDDAFLGGALHLLQPLKGARAGTDAVMLAASVAADGPVRALEAGCGVGAVALCLAWRLPRLHVTGVEIDAALSELARRNAASNGLSDRVEIINGDVTGPFPALEAKGIRREGYEHVVANPPYLPAKSARAPGNADKRRAHVMTRGGLDAWVRFLATCARPRGRLWMIHRADALPAVLAALEGRFGGVRLFPLFPRADAPATRIIISATKGSRAALQMLPGLTLHRPDGRYTDTAEALLRYGAALPLDEAAEQ
ncbi:tRNA1(Val) (adenine(37)-N6)-methyltransferase [Dichotomicrobium thermohalophilum]|nr:methyltransferase [Dichotomicrobium thermohalophilum]